MINIYFKVLGFQVFVRFTLGSKKKILV